MLKYKITISPNFQQFFNSHPERFVLIRLIHNNLSSHEVLLWVLIPLRPFGKLNFKKNINSQQKSNLHPTEGSTKKRKKKNLQEERGKAAGKEVKFGK